jgi:lysozyme
VSERSAVPIAVLALVIPFLGAWEGIDHVARHQAIDPAGVITYCSGLTNYDDATVRPGQIFSDAQCAKLLAGELPRYWAMVKREIKVEMPPHRSAAVLSFTYNEGEGTLHRSSIRRDMNAGRTEQACKDFLKYDIANGKRLVGLDNRRHAEYTYCIRED